MDFLKALTFSREGCFEPELAKADLCFTLHEIRGVKLDSGEILCCSAQVVPTRTNLATTTQHQSTRTSGRREHSTTTGSYQVNYDYTNAETDHDHGELHQAAGTKVLCNVSEQCLLKTVPLDATLFLHVWAGNSIREVEEMAFAGGGAAGAGAGSSSSSASTAAGASSGGFSPATRNLNSAGGGLPPPTVGRPNPGGFAVAKNAVPGKSARSGSQARFIGEVRIPMAALARPQERGANTAEILYYAWLQLDTMADTVPNIGGNSDQDIFQQALYAGPRNAAMPKICVSLCKDGERNKFPLRKEEEDAGFRSRTWQALLKSHQQHLTLVHALDVLDSSSGEQKREKLAEELDRASHKVSLLSNIVEEQKREMKLLQSKMADTMQSHDLKEQELHARALTAERGQEQLQGELDQTLSSLHTNKEEEVKRLKLLSQNLQMQLDQSKEDEKSTLRKFNSKIEDSNKMIMALKDEKEEAVRRIETLQLDWKSEKVEIAKESEQLKADKAELENLLAERQREFEKTHKEQRDRITALSAAKAELLKMMEQIYDTAPEQNGGVVATLDRTSLDAFHAKWS
ncbi:unnamed protein product [Amoebophrya sp. A120]|nr:unnamed protein product [Amoebophrya sp. A120]|eukprot:GSA120T00000162001.1